MEPGSAADVVDGLSALGGLIKADNLFGVLQAFVPVIKTVKQPVYLVEVL